jgi:hypothetical protein
MTNSDIFDYSLIAAGILAVIVLVVGAITRHCTARMRLLKMISVLTLSVMAGYSWTLASLYIGFTISGADWSGKSSTWLSEFAFFQAIPCGIAVGLLGIVLSMAGFLRKPKTPPTHSPEQDVPPNA